MAQEPTDRSLILKVAILYYERNYTQEEVATKIGVSRPAISKLLHEARELGLVKFFIQDINKHVVELEVELQE
ncbi:MAG: helix-turn-helix domain-containing protein, partial [Lacticaseibacillus paracasei]|nr:helix-turn-helix domain-containing protein [Lacticaseibacillus paracasei]